MKAMEMNRVRMIRGVEEVDSDPISFGCTNGGARNPAVVRPCGEEDSRSNLYFLVDRFEEVFAHRSTGTIFRDLVAEVEIGEDLVRIETIARVIDLADCHHVPTRRAMSFVADVWLRYDILSVQQGRTNRSGGTRAGDEAAPVHDTHIDSDSARENAWGSAVPSTRTNNGPSTGPRPVISTFTPGRSPIESSHRNASG